MSRTNHRRSEAKQEIDKVPRIISVDVPGFDYHDEAQQGLKLRALSTASFNECAWVGASSENLELIAKGCNANPDAACHESPTILSSQLPKSSTLLGRSLSQTVSATIPKRSLRARHRGNCWATHFHCEFLKSWPTSPRLKSNRAKFCTIALRQLPFHWIKGLDGILPSLG